MKVRVGYVGKREVVGVESLEGSVAPTQDTSMQKKGWGKSGRLTRQDKNTQTKARVYRSCRKVDIAGETRVAVKIGIDFR